ncbi:MAG: hypothetical protein QW065_01720 [Acidilobaceae archaeon]
MVKPVYGEGFFLVSRRNTIWYIITFEYSDDEEYANIVKNENLRRAEEERLRIEMQKLMDEERIIINGRETRCEVLRATAFWSNGRSYVSFITRIPYEPRKGLNIYENFYESTVAEYDYMVLWVVEDGVIESVESPGSVELLDNVAIIRVSKGEEINGYESVVFRLD